MMQILGIKHTKWDQILKKSLEEKLTCLVFSWYNMAMPENLKLLLDQNTL
jgi:hypothetical protein